MSLKKKSRCKDRIQNILDIYDSGRPLFPRSLLQDLDNQIAKGCKKIYIEDYDGQRREFDFTPSSRCRDEINGSCIRYNCIQSLTNLSPVARLDANQPPVSICHTHHYGQPKDSIAEIAAGYRDQCEVWRKSETYQSLKRGLMELKCSTATSIDKVVCFGLGSLGRLDNCSSIRSHTQHAAVETMVQVFGAGVKCYAQEPVYDDIDKKFLTSIGITPLDDPKGFLEVESKTLVFSVNPNIPVKQIVADGEWPAGMVWNTVEADEEATEWKKEHFDGDEIWVSPYTTDPDSSRVRSMVEGYQQAALHDVDDYFGDLTIYMR
ncbi:hypothetical protein ASPWEDRAFT_112566 [Aspergillus wentii DTO 134E9]|uniref:SRR1-like domain-containing protein n=1 Tax=Aspergillus wentii DTO 134E9 TaxID=1073089 RepID=A0A1L9RHX6_ASPWE|nr:uncharacterized protein ASPWEDRAFT_112566 [Aspergillus wentii DTO 134E9]OJJ34524.1 hypothetical protein ASPWEDRAFT_112566 [Aspergillus wentii DTO 134E9]